MWLSIGVAVATMLLANRHVFLTSQAAKRPSTPVPLPAALPADFPIYPGAAHLGIEEGQGQVNGRWYDRSWFASRQDGRIVADWYRAALSREGFVPTNSTESPQDEQYAFAGNRGVVRLAIFLSPGRPTSFLIDFLPTSR